MNSLSSVLILLAALTSSCFAEGILPPRAGSPLDTQPILPRHEEVAAKLAKPTFPDDGRPTLDRHLEEVETECPVDIEPSPSRQEANLQISECCDDKSWTPYTHEEACKNLCSMDFKFGEMRAAITANSCELNNAQNVLACLTNKKDVTECCVAQGVNPECEKFCTGDFPMPAADDFSTLVCGQDWETKIKPCYKACRN